MTFMDESRMHKDFSVDRLETEVLQSVSLKGEASVKDREPSRGTTKRRSLFLPWSGWSPAGGISWYKLLQLEAAGRSSSHPFFRNDADYVYRLWFYDSEEKVRDRIPSFEGITADTCLKHPLYIGETVKSIFDRFADPSGGNAHFVGTLKKTDVPMSSFEAPNPLIKRFVLHLIKFYSSAGGTMTPMGRPREKLFIQMNRLGSKTGRTKTFSWRREAYEKALVYRERPLLQYPILYPRS